MAVLSATNPYTLSVEEMRSFTASAKVEAERLYAPVWLKKTCWYFLFPVGIVLFGFWFQNLAAGIASFLFYLGITTGSNALYERLYKKKLKAVNGPDKPTSWQTFIEGDVLVERSTQAEYRYAWSYFSSVEETTNWIRLRRPVLFQLIVPKRAFTSEAEMSAFVALLKEKIGKH